MSLLRRFNHLFIRAVKRVLSGDITDAGQWPVRIKAQKNWWVCSIDSISLRSVNITIEAGICIDKSNLPNSIAAIYNLDVVGSALRFLTSLSPLFSPRDFTLLSPLLSPSDYIIIYIRLISTEREKATIEITRPGHTLNASR